MEAKQQPTTSQGKPTRTTAEKDENRKGRHGRGDDARTTNRPRESPRGKADVQLSKALSWVLRHAAPSLGLTLASDGFVPVEDVLGANHPRFRTKDGRRRYTVDDVVRVVRNNDKQRFRLKEVEVPREEGDGAAPRNEADRRAEAAIDDGDGRAEPATSRAGGRPRSDAVLCIRANQGHSLTGLRAEQLLTPLTGEELSRASLSIIHGTTRRAWDDHIRHEGLRRMTRNHIHFATGLPPRPTGASAQETRRHEDRRGGDGAAAAAPISGMRASSEVYVYANGPLCAEEGVPFYRSDNGVLLTAGAADGRLPTRYFEKAVCASSGEVLWKPTNGQETWQRTASATNAGDN